MNEKYNEQGIKVCCENCVKATFNRSTGEFAGCSWRKQPHKAEWYIHSFEPTSAAYWARIDELTAGIEKFVKENPWYEAEARALLRREEGKMNMEADMSMQSTCSENLSKNGEVLKVPNSTGLNPSNSRGLKKQQVQVSTTSGTCEAQFTAEESDGIRKLAQFSGFMIANSIIAKCDAMLKGGAK